VERLYPLPLSAVLKFESQIHLIQPVLFGEDARDFLPVLAFFASLAIERATVADEGFVRFHRARPYVPRLSSSTGCAPFLPSPRSSVFAFW